MREKLLKAFGTALALGVLAVIAAVGIGAASAVGVITYRHVLALLGG